MIRNDNDFPIKQLPFLEISIHRPIQIPYSRNSMITHRSNSSIKHQAYAYHSRVASRIAYPIRKVVESTRESRVTIG